jgi:hypothetical protein
MSITIERAGESSPDVCDLIGELNDVLGAAYESHQRPGLSRYGERRDQNDVALAMASAEK